MVQSKIQHRLALAITTFSSLAMVGVFQTILGTALPAMRLSFELDTAQAGLFGSVAWLGFALAEVDRFKGYFPQGRFLCYVPACFDLPWAGHTLFQKIPNLRKDRLSENTEKGETKWKRSSAKRHTR